MFPTQLQVSIANEFKIPVSQAHLINILKFREYLKWRREPEQRVCRMLDEIWLKGLLREQREWM